MEAIGAHAEGDQRRLDRIAVVEICILGTDFLLLTGAIIDLGALTIGFAED
jgi:hypothetical protein